LPVTSRKDELQWNATALGTIQPLSSLVGGGLNGANFGLDIAKGVSGPFFI
jgi:hypothetical protein